MLHPGAHCKGERTELPGIVEETGDREVLHVDGRREVRLRELVRIPHEHQGIGVHAIAEVRRAGEAIIPSWIGTLAVCKLSILADRSALSVLRQVSVVFEVRVSGIEIQLSLWIGAVVRQAVQVALLRVNSGLDYMRALRPGNDILNVRNRLLHPHPVVVKTAGHEQARETLSGSGIQSRHRVIAPVLIHAEIVVVALAAVIVVHVEAVDRRGRSHVSRRRYKGHGGGGLVRHGSPEGPDIVCEKGVGKVSGGYRAGIKDRCRRDVIQINRILRDLRLPVITDGKRVVLGDVVVELGVECGAVLGLQHFLDVIEAVGIGKWVGIRRRQPIDQGHAARVGKGGDIAVHHAVSVRQPVLRLAHGQNRVGIGVAVRARAAELGVQRRLVEVSLAFRLGRHPAPQGLRRKELV